MTASIPASALADVIPGVLGAGGNPLSLNAVFGTNDTSIPIGTVQPFASATDVSDWFGPNAAETTLANVYFAGFINCTVLPGTLYFAQFNTANVAAYLRGGSVAALSLTQLQALSGTVSVTVNGVLNVSAAINLSGATSFTNAAALIQSGLQSATAVFSGTGSQAAGVVTIATTVSGSLAVGDVLTGAGVDAPATITSFGTYTVLAGTGTVNVSTSATVSLGAIDVAGTALVTYDTLRDAFVITSPTTGTQSTMSFAATSSLATGLNLTSATGAVLSQGAAATTPAAFMASIVAATQNWATFMTVAEQSLSNKEAFAAWFQTPTALNRYLYVCQDSDSSPTTSPTATGSFGNIVNAAEDTGVMPVYDVSGTGVIAAFQCAIAASINFNQQNGRTVFAFRGQSGLSAQVTDQTIYNNLIANGYNCYAAFATANQQFIQNQPGQISGPFEWADTFINQVYLNSQLQLAIMTLSATVPSVPYVTRGYNLIRNALVGNAATQNSPPTGPIEQALYFGTIVKGVTLSGVQSAALNSATGDPGATATIQNTGWYLQILDPGAIVRGGRGSPTINFWYTDGGSIQKISMSSVDVL
jgi:Protein of unknown function (DUF3383)